MLKVLKTNQALIKVQNPQRCRRKDKYLKGFYSEGHKDLEIEQYH